MSPGGLPSTVLPAADADAEDRLAAAVRRAPDTRRDAVAQVVADHPRFVAAWAALGDAAGDTIERYAAYRVGYHRGLDAAAGQWLAWIRVRAVGGADERRIPSLPAGLAGDGGCDRGARRGRALRAVLAAARPVRPTYVTQPSIGGAVLCGGRSERFGRDKALVDIDGQPMAEHVARVVESAGCSPVVFVGGVGERLGPASGRPFIADSWPGEGPLGAVVDVLQWFRRRNVDGVVVAACDLPKLSVDAVRAVASERGAAVALRRAAASGVGPLADLGGRRRRAVVHIGGALTARGARGARRSTRHGADRSAAQRQSSGGSCRLVARWISGWGA